MQKIWTKFHTKKGGVSHTAIDQVVLVNVLTSMPQTIMPPGIHRYSGYAFIIPREKPMAVKIHITAVGTLQNYQIFRG